MPTFNSIAEIEKYAQLLIKKSQQTQNSNVRKTVGQSNTRKVESEVYAKYDPKEYDRRGRDGGLADERSIEVTSVQSSGGTTQVILENTVEGADSLRGKPLLDTIENTIPNDWYNPNGEWVEGRPFINAIVDELKDGNELRQSLVKDLKSVGLEVL